MNKDIAVIIPSRNRPDQLMETVQELYKLSTGEDRIVYYIIYDQDDISTEKVVEKLKLQINALENHPNHLLIDVKGSNDVLVTKRINQLVRDIPLKDYYVSLCDDMIPITSCWNYILTEEMECNLLGSWTEEGDPHNFTYPIFSKGWVECFNRLYPEYFPFWYSDSWCKEVHDLAFGVERNYLISDKLILKGNRGKTNQLRDVKFWFEFFSFTRNIRIEEADQLQNFLGGLYPKDRRPLLYSMKERDEAQLLNVNRYEERFGDNSEPSKAYLEAKKVAEELLDNIEPKNDENFNILSVLPKDFESRLQKMQENNEKIAEIEGKSKQIFTSINWPSVYIVIPTSNGMIHSNCSKLLDEITIAFMTLGIKYDKKFIENGSNIDSIRTNAANEFMNDTNFDRILWIDSDVGGTASDVIKLLSTDELFVAGAYRIKEDSINDIVKYACNLVNPLILHGVLPLAELNWIGCGFTLVKKEAYKIFQEAYPETEYSIVTDENGNKISSKFFYYNTSTIEGKLNSEDIYFCYKLRQAGVKLWLRYDITDLTHRGFKIYSSDNIYMDLFAPSKSEK